MDNISKLLDAISAEGKAAADKIIENGRNNAADVKKLYEKEAGIDEKAIIDKAEKEVREIIQRGVSQAGIESRNIKLKARREALAQAFSIAKEKLGELSTDDKKKFYESLIRKYTNSQEVTIVLNQADRKSLGNKVTVPGINIVLDEAVGNFEGGLVMKEGTRETNCTFEVLIDGAKKEMESDIAAMLFS